jgi:tetratricopeptide (TPR) repeat protein
VWLRAAAECTLYRELRLFRNHPSIRFEGVIHENIWPAILRFMAAEGGTIVKCGLTLDHVGYHGSQDHKHRRNLPLLLKRLEQDPEHSYSRWHLGAVYNGLGDVERARDTWRRGIAAARRRPGRDWSDAGCYIGLVQLDFEQSDVACPLLDEAIGRFPDHPQLLWLKAQLLIHNKWYEEALPILEDLAAWRSRPRLSDGIVGADSRFFGLFAFDGLATCHFRLKHYDKAAHYYELAEACASEPLEYRVKRQLCLKLAARAVSSVGPTTQLPGGVPDLEVRQTVAAMAHVACH